MSSLEIYYKGKIMYARFEIFDREDGDTDYKLYDKNGYTYYVVRRKGKKWAWTRGFLPEELKQSIIDALIKLTNKNIVCIFHHDGVRQILEVTSINGSGSDHYHLYLNNYLLGNIWKTEHFSWRFWMHKGKPITTADIDIIIEMIEAGEIK